MRELLTGYGPVALIWFDTPRMMTGDRPHRFANIVRELQPETLIDGRLGSGRRLREHRRQRHPARRVRARRGKSRRRSTTPGAIRTDDTDWKSPGQIAFKLVDIVSKGGNYLLNVGPTAEGRHPAAEPGHPAHRRPVAAGQRRGGVRRRRHAVRRGARRTERPRREGRARRCARLPADAVARHDQAGQAVLHVLRRAAGAVRAAAR